jgi:glycosyltransferase involved in cell wall biosynthesis
MDVTVAIGTYGSADWVERAHQHPIRSALEAGVPFVHVHGRTLCDARNAALDAVMSEWVCFVDADDELDRRFFERIELGTADIRAPAVRYMGGQLGPYVPRVVGHNHACTAECLEYGNWIVIGAVARAKTLRNVGGFHDYPMYEDWDLWVRCWKAGASIEAIPGAIYRAYVRQDSRNRAPAQAERLRVHQWIAADNGLPVPA